MPTREARPPSAATSGLVLGILGLVLPPAAVTGLVVSLVARRRSRERPVRVALAVSTATTLLWTTALTGAAVTGAGGHLATAVRTVGEGGVRGVAASDARLDIGDVLVGDCLAAQDPDLFDRTRLVPCDAPGARLVVAVERVHMTGIASTDLTAETARLTARCEERVGALATGTSRLRPRAVTPLPNIGTEWYRLMVCTVEDVDGGPPPVDLVATTGVGHGQRPGVTSPDS